MGSWRSAKAPSTPRARPRRKDFAGFDERQRLRQRTDVPPRKSSDPGEASDLSIAVEQLAEEVRVLRQAVDELRDDVVWAARQVLGAGYEASGQPPPRPVDPLAPDADPQPDCTPAAIEASDENQYCCDSPHLTWHGSPDAPGIACENCGFIVAEEGNILIWHEAKDQGPAAQEASSGSERQERLFD